MEDKKQQDKEKGGKKNLNKAIETEMGTKTSSGNKKHLTSVY